MSSFSFLLKASHSIFILFYYCVVPVVTNIHFYSLFSASFSLPHNILLVHAYRHTSSEAHSTYSHYLLDNMLSCCISQPSVTQLLLHYDWLLTIVLLSTVLLLRSVYALLIADLIVFLYTHKQLSVLLVPGSAGSSLLVTGWWFCIAINWLSGHSHG